jgi:hypothetical protein
MADTVPATARQRAAAVLPELRDSVTLAQWMHAHPGDTVRVYRRVRLTGYMPDNWCVLAESRLPDGVGGEVWRRAVFYTPLTPQAAVLPPPGTASADLLDQCRLGHVLIGFGHAETVAADDWTAPSLNGVAARHSEPHLARDLWEARTRAQLIEDAFTIASVGGIAERRLRSLLGVSAPAGAVADAAMLRMRMLLDGAPPSNSRNRASLMIAREIDGVPPLSTADADTLVDALRLWVSGAAALPPERRAAVFVIADLVVASVWEVAAYNFPQKVTPLGAVFRQSTRYPGYEYTRNWLAGARDMNAPGRAGEVAFLASLLERIDHSGGCIDPVIARGERYLREHSGSGIRAEVHFMVGEAFADIVALAAGATDYPSQYRAADYAPRVDSARTRAVEEFRAAVALAGPSHERSRMVWQAAYRLMAGTPPLRTFFHCDEYTSG